MRFASVIATLTRAIQPNTDFHKHGDTSIVFAARDLPVHPLLPRAPNYLPMGGPPTTQANPLDSNPSYLPLFRLSSTPAPTIPRIDQGTLVHRIILSNANLRSDQARRRYIYIYSLSGSDEYSRWILWKEIFQCTSISRILYIYIVVEQNDRCDSSA